MVVSFARQADRFLGLNIIGLLQKLISRLQVYFINGKLVYVQRYLPKGWRPDQTEHLRYDQSLHRRQLRTVGKLD